QLDIAHNENKLKLPDHTQPGGGNRNIVSRIESVECAIKFYDFTPENMALALNASVSSVVGGSIVDEPHKAYADGFIPTNFPGISAVNCQESSGGLGTDFTEGVDYEIHSGGILILSGYTGVEGADIFIDYDHVGIDIVEALIDSGKEYELFFDGINEAQSGAPHTMEVFKIKFSPAQTLTMISESDFVGLELTGELLIDTSKTGVGISKYYKKKKQTAA
ncbi:hypothetical protein KAT92_03440, partial [Candidatus Babeliales bacterium]|nr:hypothetical protein [Candidatus Babeliales bacterium]